MLLEELTPKVEERTDFWDSKVDLLSLLLVNLYNSDSGGANTHHTTP